MSSLFEGWFAQRKLKKIESLKETQKRSKKQKLDRALYKLFKSDKFSDAVHREEKCEQLLRGDYDYITLHNQGQKINHNNAKINKIIYRQFKYRNITNTRYNAGGYTEVTFDDGLGIQLWSNNIPYAFMSRVKIHKGVRGGDYDDILVMPRLQYFVIKKILKFNPGFCFYNVEEKVQQDKFLDTVYDPLQKDHLLSTMVKKFGGPAKKLDQSSS